MPHPETASFADFIALLCGKLRVHRKPKPTSKTNLMEQHLNRIELKGNVGNIRISENAAGKVARFSLATNYIYTNRENETVVETTWHNIVAWEGKNIRDIERITKGEKVYVSGRLRMSRFTGNDGEDRQMYEVVAAKLLTGDELAAPAS